MTSTDLSIIVVNWNSKDYLRHCIASILGNTVGMEYEIVVVDSGSFDGCGDMLQRVYPQVRFIQSERNVGFALANNLGASYARGSTMLFLNPDTEVRGHAIEHLYSHVRKLPDAGIVGCRLVNRDGSLQTSCVQPLPTILNQVLDAEILHGWFPTIDLWMSATMFEGATSPVPVEAVSGACMMIRREVFDQVRGFSSDYFMYAEDLDLCYKTRAAGFTNYYIVKSEVVHYGGGSTDQSGSRFSNVMIPESISRLLRKTRGKFYSLCYRGALCGAAVVRLIMLTLWLPYGLIRHKPRELSAVTNKWVAVLRWGLGLENWIHKYDRSKKAAAEVKEGGND